MARRPAPPSEDEETPPWLEAAQPRRRAIAEPLPPPKGDSTFISWRTLVIGGVIALVAAIGLVIGVRRLTAPTASGALSGAEAGGEVALIRAPSTPYKTRVGPDTGPAAPDQDPMLAGGSGPTTVAPENPDVAATTAPSGDADAPSGTATQGGDNTAKADATAPAQSATPAPPPPRSILPDSEAHDPVTTPSPGAGASRASKPVRSSLADVPASAPTPPRRRNATTDIAAIDQAIGGGSVKRKPSDVDAASSAPASIARSLQLGAFSSREKAERVWTGLVSAHPELARFSYTIAPVERGDVTLYRLRASGTGAESMCAKLSAAGAGCFLAKR